MSDMNDWCFACGPRNPIGLKLTFWEENDVYLTDFTAGPEHQGYNGIMHGGLISTLLDEIMARYLYAQGLTAVTAKLEVRFRQPTPIREKLTISGWITSKRGKMVELAGKITLQDGTVTAEGKAMVAIKGDE
ncbi:PaaI family thioesterase [Sporomusa sp. KB1]|jgi:acyl-coenzyme A thioesterase PaaI-like protein|uniref:PaaI family thioesterase n=1 Tax=Sporomusa sp. KB1 TaxID=943346 RepID=UPI0011A70F12|nr:hotdog fold domain-containing protein [Sporomusa sp. KB1]TWH45172.1 acyl-coenzyme A thioesterase PaaI-like protein [Sporomusa sp. KB1]